MHATSVPGRTGTRPPPATPVRRWLLRISAAGFIALVFGCAHCPLCGGEWRPTDGLDANPEAGVEWRTVSGRVSCLERVPLLPTFEIRVRLVSLGSPTCAMEVVGEVSIATFDAFPVPFAIDYLTPRPEPGKAYGLIAEMLAQGTPIFATDTQYKLNVEDPASEVELVIVRLKSGGEGIE